MRGFAKNTNRNKETPKTVHKNRPCLNADFPFEKCLAASASATKGVMAVEKPIPKDMAINIKLLPRDTAASSAVPNCPTITLSINCTKVCPNMPNMTGADSFQLYLNSLV